MAAVCPAPIRTASKDSTSSDDQPCDLDVVFDANKAVTIIKRPWEESDIDITNDAIAIMHKSSNQRDLAGLASPRIAIFLSSVLQRPRTLNLEYSTLGNHATVTTDLGRVLYNIHAKAFSLSYRTWIHNHMGQPLVEMRKDHLFAWTDKYIGLDPKDDRKKLFEVEVHSMTHEGMSTMTYTSAVEGGQEIELSFKAKHPWELVSGNIL